MCSLYLHHQYTNTLIWLVVWNIFSFPYIGNNNPNWLIFFGGVETTNQSLSIEILSPLYPLKFFGNVPMISLGFAQFRASLLRCHIRSPCQCLQANEALVATFPGAWEERIVRYKSSYTAEFSHVWNIYVYIYMCMYRNLSFHIYIYKWLIPCNMNLHIYIYTDRVWQYTYVFIYICNI